MGYGTKSSSTLKYKDLRKRYWQNRAEEEGICTNTFSCSSMADDLYQYYDKGEVVTTEVWAPSKSEELSIALDVIGIPLGFVGLGNLKYGANTTKFLQRLGLADSTLSFGIAASKKDTTGSVLAFASGLPVVGGFASMMALSYDVAGAIKDYEWVPSIPR